jgi:hypothetical protein
MEPPDWERFAPLERARLFSGKRENTRRIWIGNDFDVAAWLRRSFSLIREASEQEKSGAAGAISNVDPGSKRTEMAANLHSFAYVRTAKSRAFLHFEFGGIDVNHVRMDDVDGKQLRPGLFHGTRFCCGIGKNCDVASRRWSYEPSDENTQQNCHGDCPCEDKACSHIDHP